MTFMDAREAIRVAIDAVPGVNGFTKRPAALKAGSAWVLLSGFDPGPGYAVAGVWRVVVVLGGDEALAVAKLDELLPPLLEAIQPVAYVDRGETFVIETSAGDLYAVAITARSE